MKRNSKGARQAAQVSERDIYARAQVILREYGLKGASRYAAEKITEFREQDDSASARVWGRIRAALLDLSDIRVDDDPIH